MKGGIYNDVRYVRVFQNGILVFKLLDDQGQPLGNTFEHFSQLMFYVDWRKEFFKEKRVTASADATSGVHSAGSVRQLKQAGLR